MNRLAQITLYASLLALSAPAALPAESRGKPYSEDQLLQNASKVFVGEVMEITTFEKYNRTIPARVRVLLGIKGNVPRGERVVQPKHPGNFAYFDEEFSQAEIGALGVFYVGTKGQTDLLIGFRKVSREQE